MGYALNQQVVLETEECCSCGVMFAMPGSMQRRCRNDGSYFYCPNGHPQHYSKSEIDRLQEKLAAQTRMATQMAERARVAEIEQTRLEAQQARLKRRVKIVGLKDHMRDAHKLQGAVSAFLARREGK